MKKALIVGAIALWLLSGPLIGNALAQYTLAPYAPVPAEPATANTGDTAFMLVSAAMVLIMTPGLAFFYGGFVRSRNVLNTMMMSFLAMGLVGVTWILVGYSLSFAPGIPFVGGLQWAFLNNVGLEVDGYLPEMALSNSSNLSSYATTIPHQAYMIYQAMFAIITPALISGAIAERMSFRVYTLFMLLWSLLVYCPVAHMIWAKGGFLGLHGGIGALDFAGGTVVHISSGISAFVAAILLGPRRTYPNQLAPPHNVPFILLGASILWYGWFGFNAGSALSVATSPGAGASATVAFVATNTAAAAAMLTWLLLEQVLRGKPTAVGAATGAVTGLVGITPAAGFVTPIAALLIGSIVAVCCFYAVSFKMKLKVDDALDTFTVHGVGGTVGALLTGLFATKTVNSLGRDGLFFGNPGQLGTQIVAVVITYSFAAVGTFAIVKLLNATVGLRPNPGLELEGMDIHEHGEEGYGRMP